MTRQQHRLKALPWEQMPVAHTVSRAGHGRWESRSVKTMAIAANLGGIAFPEAQLAMRIHRRRQESGKRQPRETVYEDASTVHTGSAPQAKAALRNLAVGRLRLLGADNIAKTTRAIRDAPEPPSGSGASPIAHSYRELVPCSVGRRTRRSGVTTAHRVVPTGTWTR